MKQRNCHARTQQNKGRCAHKSHHRDVTPTRSSVKTPAIGERNKASHSWKGGFKTTGSI